MTGSRSRIVFAPLPEDGPSQRQPEIALAKKHLARHPGVPLEQGLEWTIAYFERLLREAPGAPPEHRTALGAEP
jgi:UDP-glucuronate decarboxylase